MHNGHYLSVYFKDCQLWPTSWRVVDEGGLQKAALTSGPEDGLVGKYTVGVTKPLWCLDIKKRLASVAE